MTYDPLYACLTSSLRSQFAFLSILANHRHCTTWHCHLDLPPLNPQRTTTDPTITPLSTITCPRLTSPHFTLTIITSTPKCHHIPCTIAFSLNPHPLMPKTTAACHSSPRSQPWQALPPRRLLSLLWPATAPSNCLTLPHSRDPWSVGSCHRCSTSATSAQMAVECFKGAGGRRKLLCMTIIRVLVFQSNRDCLIAQCIMHQTSPGA